MKAAVWKGIEQLDIEDLPVPEPKDPYDVQVKVVACGVCATDMHILEGKFPMFKPPRVIGHEFTGVVSAIGTGVTKVKVGDRIAVETGLACDRCYFCRDGREHQCLHRYAHPGGFAEYALYPDRNVHKLPDALSFEFAALAEPVACVLHAIDLAKVRSGDVALVLAGGTIGCIMTQLLLHSGASKVLISEPRAHRREICKAVGGIPVDPKSQDLATFVKEHTDGLGPEIVFDCLGHPALLEQGIELVQKGGTVFGPQPRDYSYELPKKARRSALRSALAKKHADQELIVASELEVKEPKTREAVALLKAYKLESALLVDTADNGHQGFQLATSNAYDIILSDIHMPHWDGFKFIEAIQVVNPHLPILIITSTPDDREMQDRLWALVRKLSLPVTEQEVRRLTHMSAVAAFRPDLKIRVWRDAEGYYTLVHDTTHPEEFLFPLGKAFLLCEMPWDAHKVI